MLNNHKQVAVVVSVVLLMLIHGGLLFKQQLGQYKQQRPQISNVIPQFEREVVTPSLEHLAALSLSFGITPTLVNAAKDKQQKDELLNEKMATLVAVSEQNNLLIAKLMVQEQGKATLISLKIGDTLLGYRLDKLNLTSAVFVQGDSQIILHMFKRDNQNVAAH
jgi:hypothetical protein